MQQTHSTLQYNQESHTMMATKQLVISLNRLTLPSHLSIKRITLSIQNAAIEYFIQNPKTVRSQKINFYREKVFVQYTSQGLKVNLYSVQEDGSKKIIISLRVETQELNTIHKKPKAFKTESQGYQLIWDSWVFSGDSSYLSQESSRDYTQLDLPLNLVENNQSLNSSHSSYCDYSIRSRRPNHEKKRSNSTDETSSNQEKQSNDNEDGNQNNVSESSPQKNKMGQHNLISPKKRGNVGFNLYARPNGGPRMQQ